MSLAAWNPLQQLQPGQLVQLAAFEEEILRLNRRHNLISRASEEEIGVRHLRHCLALTRKRFPEHATVVDWGTGGGLPAIPLAIAFPQIQVWAVDAAQKKVLAVQAMKRRIGLPNLQVWLGRAEEWPGTAEYSVSRATAPLATLWRWHEKSCAAARAGRSDEWCPGLLCLKGGALDEEIAELHAKRPTVTVEIVPLESLFAESYFARKVIVALCSAPLENDWSRPR